MAQLAHFGGLFWLCYDYDFAQRDKLSVYEIPLVSKGEVY